ncbi:hypothetical protein [Agromyces albus]|uniref:Uncharacterized protein n=1 Tax=Agromyces albus TaxID=205332 RepID=A0A4Q2L6J4_9MICO|nr:hypothetical protein [Agromyces albus]RXZ71851.1 hypothetical protein ESP51_06885 [Agromyces albus]
MNATPYRLRPEGDELVIRLRSAWSDAQLDITKALAALAELDEAIQTATQAGIEPMGIAIESRSRPGPGIELKLIEYVVAGGSSLDYLVAKAPKRPAD